MKSLAITVDALHVLMQRPPVGDWLVDFKIEGRGDLIIDRENGAVLVSCPSSTIDSGLLVVDISRARFGNTAGTVHSLFSRLSTAALSHLTRTVSIPYSWGSFTWEKDRRFFSFYAHSFAQGDGERVYLERDPKGGHGLYVYAVEDEVRSFEAVPISYEAWSASEDLLLNALSKRPTVPSRPAAVGSAALGSAIDLADFASDITSGASFDEWYRSRLTSQQRDFVDRGLERPVRLRGSAGTGKTLALCMKLIQDCRTLNSMSREAKIGFILHSTSNKERVASTLAALDERGDLASSRPVKVEVLTLYELANSALASTYHSLNPIDLDAREGRLFQAAIISDVIRDNRIKWALLHEGRVSDQFLNGMMSDAEPFEMIVDRVNLEFQNILDAEGIRIGTERAEQYIRGEPAHLSRGGWNQDERELILKIHDEYKSYLFKNNCISVDQLVADYSRFLDSHVWDALRERSGYDALFVDEAHLFNASEQAILPKILRSRSRASDGKPIFIAYDLKQTGREAGDGPDTATGRMLRTNVSESELVQLDKIFRFTKEIAAFIEAVIFEIGAFQHLDEADRALDASGDMSGALPMVREYASDIELYNSVFPEAAKTTEQKGRRGQVAVICFDPKRYARYANAGQYKRSILAIESRDELNQVRYSGKRFIYSEPEQLAGHQFEDVYLINVDAGLFGGDVSPLQKREAFSRLYLGLTRASNRLHVVASKDGGGLPRFLKSTLEQGIAAGGASDTKRSR